MFNTLSKTDVVLVQFPNKTIELPPLGTAVLTESIKKAGYTCTQYDYNILLKDAFIQPGNLHRMHEEVLNFLWERNLDNITISTHISSFQGLLNQIKQDLSSINSLYDVMKLLQERKYEKVFTDNNYCTAFTYLIKVISFSNKIFDIVTTSPEVEKAFPDLFIFQMVNNLLHEIQNKNPYYIGLSIVEMQRQFSLWAIKKLREEFGYTGKIVVGGSDITYFMEGYLKNFPTIDYAIYREGEIATVELLKYLKGEDKSIEQIPNLIYRKGQEIHTNEPREIKNFEDIIPNFDDLPLNKYITNALPIQASRGCSWGKCTYCKHFRTYGKKYYAGNPQGIVNQLNLLSKRYNTALFHFVDDDFPLELKNKVSDKILAENLEVYWLTYSRLDKNITKEMLRKWYRAGLYVIEWGLESACDTVLETVKKGIDLRNVRRLLLDAHSTGILNKVFMFHNLPTENYEDLLASVSFLKEYAQQGVIRVFWEILTPLELLIDTPLYNENIKSQPKAFKKVFKPRGELVAQGSYISKENYTIKKTILVDYVSKLRALGNKHNILEMNDEAVLFDLLLEVLSKNQKALKLHTRII